MVHASSPMEAIAALTVELILVVTDTLAPPRIAAQTDGRPQYAESILTSTGVPAGRSRPACFTASAISRSAPRGEPHEPFRSRCATMIGAVAAVASVAISALRPRTRE